MSLLNYKTNPYDKAPKDSTCTTPVGVSQFLFDVLSTGYPLGFPAGKFRVIVDPAIGSGRLTDPWPSSTRIVGVDINNQGARCDLFIEGRFEDQTDIETPDLVVVNPPFNAAAKKKLYPEIFLEHVFELWGERTPVAMFVPAGFRNNQRRVSKRFRRLRDNKSQITSIISLLLDTFPGVNFPMEIIIWNVGGIAPHFFLPEYALV